MKRHNEITGDLIITKRKSKTFDDNFDAIFRKPKVYTDAEVLNWKWHDDLIEQEGYEADKKLQQEKDDATM
jgi:hypothetical protein